MKIGLCPLDEGTLFQFLVSLGFSNNSIKNFNVKDKLNLSCPKELLVDIDLINSGQINPEYQGEDVEIILETDQFIVLNKPEKIHCFPLKYSEQNNILSYLRSKNKFEGLNIDLRNPARGLLYRIDFETSGLLILAKKENIYSDIRSDFQQVMKEKIYLAIVQGEIKNELSLKHYLKPHGPRGSLIKCFDHTVEGSVKAEIMVKNLSYNKQKNLSLVKVELKEGHRHQIRSQLSYIGHAILGDILYGGHPEQRVYLHAYEYKLKGNELFRAKKMNLFRNFFDLDRFL
jgi:23S rRNA pseudouridine1911/1915/1917 synthase